MDINFEYYKIFYYVAKYRNMTKAAALLGSNQPNITRVIKLLEAQLGCQLMVRKPRGICLTEEGEMLYSHVEVACQHFFNAQKELGRHGTQAVRTIEIGVTETALHLFLLDAMQDFRKEYPQMRIKIHNHATPEILNLLSSGKLEFAVATTPILPPHGFFCEPVLEFQEILVGGVKYGFLCGGAVGLEELMAYSWVGLGKGTSTYDFYRDFFLKHNLEMELDMEVATSGLMLPLIQNGFGIGFVPESLAKPLLLEKRLVQIPVGSRIPRRSIQIVSGKERPKSLAAERFYQYLKGL